ncbi:Capsule synthesis protein CapA [Penicillium capsulatum]|uniref:Capsule synthesis protein CapA n=1 Tax=Penicillium capsulatum TaxID=69766 RepID=A0A9W9I2Z9_9EURO|nr:Capsule synthesis protein CapA [Penicillium capsulatum]KAJ6108774.1 Capsule synthesis protein CapA [Penicillium capsulatum]
MAEGRSFTVSLVGDVMLGRVVDQLFPRHVHNDHDQDVAAHFVERYPAILGGGNYSPASPWGTTLSLLRDSDLSLINLETSATTCAEPWPDKAFNYRMHPANLAPILHAAHVDYAGLANNHTLDFGAEGLVETAWTLRDAGVAFAGAGESTNQAFKPVSLSLPRQRHPWQSRQAQSYRDRQESRHGEAQAQSPTYTVHIYSASDHPRSWSSIPTFHLIDYSPATRVRLRQLLLSDGAAIHPPDTPDPDSDSSADFAHETHEFHHRAHHHHKRSARREPPALKIFSVHWGPNYSWHPAAKIRALAHFLIDECGVDIVHGHSSHHVQGVETYHGKIIIYGCGDFVDDYALNEEYRNDLGAVWRVCLKEQGGGVVLDRLEIFPTRVDRFRAMLLDVSDSDHRWVRERISWLSSALGTSVRADTGELGQLIVDLNV